MRLAGVQASPRTDVWNTDSSSNDSLGEEFLQAGINLLEAKVEDHAGVQSRSFKWRRIAAAPPRRAAPDYPDRHQLDEPVGRRQSER